jgi:polysaccharide biosynthesis/export protein
MIFQRFCIPPRTPFTLVQSTLLVTLLTLAAHPAIATTPPNKPTAQPFLTAAVTQGDPYTLGAGDNVRIDIFRAPQYSGETQVLADGTLNLPLAGNISVDGMTVEQATAAIAAGYSRFFRRPLITLSLLSRRPLEIGVAGEVSRPGAYSVNVEGGQFPTINQLLQTAGGTTLSANVRQVEIRRPQRGGSDQVINVDLMQLLQTGDLKYDIALKDGDTIFVPAAATPNIAESGLLSDASFAADNAKPINISVAGEVFRPGPYTVAGSARTGEAGVPGGSEGGGGLPTVTRAIQVAGGIKPTANIREVLIRRSTRSGTPQEFKVNLWDLLKSGDSNQDPILQEGDSIVVTQIAALNPAEAAALASTSFSPDSITINVVGEVAQPGTFELPPNTPLNQAILAAGGFNARSRRGSVNLVRLKEDGSVSREAIPVDFTQGIADGKNPSLRDNDVVVVGRSGLAATSDALGQVLAPIGNAFSLFQFPFNFLRIFR